ncbi:MAG: GAF domain-containing protein, partial [Desulfovibrio sp.]|nr:GAF domain-containing protein [Desulfovibrio sp.]
MEIKIWGVRGSTPVSGSGYLKYGGDTSCVEVRLGSGESILFDAGTGLVKYGRETRSGELSRVICFTHTRYDHIQGLPFFPGTFRKNAPLLLIGPSIESSFKNSLKQFFNGVNTPWLWENLPEHETREVEGYSKFDIFGAIVETCPTIHLGGCLAWKITADGWTFGITGDHEIPLDKKNPKQNLANERLMSFLTGCDIVLADAYFSEEMRARHPDGGHSSPAQWQKALADRDVGKIYFTHFNPVHNDNKLDALLTETSEDGVPLGLAYEGAVIRKDGLLEPAKEIGCASCEFSRKVAGYSDTHAVLVALLNAAREKARAEAGTVYLVSGGALNFAAAQNDKLFPASSANKYLYFNSQLPLDKSSIAGYVASTGEILNIDNVYMLPSGSEYSFNWELDQASGYTTKSVLAAPLTNGQNKVIGVLQLIKA